MHTSSRKYAASRRGLLNLIFSALLFLSILLAPAANAGSVNLTGGPTPTSGNTVDISAGSTLDFSAAGTFIADSPYYDTYSISYSFPFCNCSIPIVGYGTANFDGYEGAESWYTDEVDGAAATTLSVSDNAGNTPQTFTGGSSASGNVSFTYLTPGLYTLVLSATSSYEYYDYGNECGGSAYGQEVNGSYSAWCTNPTSFDHATTYTPSASETFQIDVAPVPLPASFWILLSGLGGIGAVARKRRTP
jgi:hypothetical protein